MNFVEKMAYYASPAGRLKLLWHLPNLIKLFGRLLRDRRVGLVPKLIFVAGVAYFIFPLDMIPDFPLVGLGQIDDFVVLLVASRLFIALAPRNVVEEHVQLIDSGA